MATRFATMVTLMAGVPLDPMYKHTLTFANFAAQTTYFESKRVFTPATFNFISYQRHNSGVIKLEAPMNILGTVNYLSFVNANYQGQGDLHEAKTFYAFITDIEYISDTVVAISYSIDVLQTWMFDYTLNPCYVEREHANSDNVGDNRINEGIDTGPYVEADWEPIDYWDSTQWEDQSQRVANSNFIVIATQAPDGTQSTFQYNGVVGSLFIRNCFSVDQLDNLIQQFYNGATQSLVPIISITMYPKYYMPSASMPLQAKTWTLTKDQSVGFGAFIGYDPATQGTKSYTPKNNKLYCYPYNYMIFEGPEGNSNVLKFEDFASNNIHQFYSKCAIYPNVETMCAPFMYENYNSNISGGELLQGVNTKYALFSKSYPVCGVASDAYSAWWAQNRSYYPLGSAYVEAADAISNTVNSKPERPNTLWGMVQSAWDSVQGYYEGAKQYLSTIGETSNLLQNLGTGFARAGSRLGNKKLEQNMSQDLNIAGSDMSEIGKTLAAVNSHKAVPDTLISKAANSGILHSVELDCYKIRYTKIRPEMAEVIDNYFSCFGYATHVVKVPNVTGRRNWNYVQTVGCTISGNIPAEAEQQITAIFDRGVTFWHIPANIHNYNANNDII